MSDAPKSQEVIPIHVRVTREPFSDFYQLYLDDGQIEELEIEELKKWFDDRGADMYAVEKALDYVWNFQQAEITIRCPKSLKPAIGDRYMPKLS